MLTKYRQYLFNEVAEKPKDAKGNTLNLDKIMQEKKKLLKALPKIDVKNSKKISKEFQAMDIKDLLKGIK